MRGLIDDPSSTPSARLLDELRNANCSFFEFVLSAAQNHRDYFSSITPLSDERNVEFETEVSRSIACQLETEASDTIGIEEYLANYFDSD